MPPLILSCPHVGVIEQCGATSWGDKLARMSSFMLLESQAKFEQKGKFVAKKGGSSKQRKKRVLEKQEQSELGWGGFDDVAPPTKTTVVLRHAFHPDDFSADFTLREQLEDDFRDEANKQGAHLIPPISLPVSHLCP